MDSGETKEPNLVSCLLSGLYKALIAEVTFYVLQKAASNEQCLDHSKYTTDVTNIYAGMFTNENLCAAITHCR